MLQQLLLSLAQFVLVEHGKRTQTNAVTRLCLSITQGAVGRAANEPLCPRAGPPVPSHAAAAPLTCCSPRSAPAGLRVGNHRDAFVLSFTRGSDFSAIKLVRVRRAPPQLHQTRTKLNQPSYCQTCSFCASAAACVHISETVSF